MVRVITQETYDEVVKENIDEFDMTPEEAIKEAVAQFEAQGVDLSNIIKDLALGSGDNHVVTENVSKLKELCSGKYDHDAVLKELSVLKLLSETLQVIRKLTLDDDVRVEFENTKPPLVSELMLTIASLLVRHELCKMVADCGVDVLFTVLADNYDNVVVVQQADKL
ncbi:hypothetical protein HF086_011958 [Spodoptera exigua]|uniref:Armadillo repeat-containing protein 6 n=1 Tax=Spodoptera exigua TaxID=7107 RepID=A0A922M795_SPOEX|nr:hypothetical protein HF086_011958 [Spodoptera exigua]